MMMTIDVSAGSYSAAVLANPYYQENYFCLHFDSFNKSALVLLFHPPKKSKTRSLLNDNYFSVCGFLLSTSDNYQFLKGMKNLVARSGYKLKICHEYMNRGDRWMQVNDTKCKLCVTLSCGD